MELEQRGCGERNWDEGPRGFGLRLEWGWSGQRAGLCSPFIVDLLSSFSVNLPNAGNPSKVETLPGRPGTGVFVQLTSGLAVSTTARAQIGGVPDCQDRLCRQGLIIYAVLVMERVDMRQADCSDYYAPEWARLLNTRVGEVTVKDLLSGLYTVCHNSLRYTGDTVDYHISEK